MFIKNPDNLKSDLVFYCTDEDLKNRLIKNNIPLLSKKIDENGMTIWIFSKTKSLGEVVKNG